MATKKNGIDLQFSIATKEANENLRQLSSQVTTLNKSLGITDETMKGVGKSVETYQTKINELSNKKEVLIKKQEELQKMFRTAVDLYGENSEEARKWGDQLLTNEKNLVKVNNEIDKTESEMKKYIKSNNEAKDSNHNLNDSLENLKEGFTVFKGVMSDLISNGIQKLASAINGQLSSAIDRVDTVNSYKKTMENLGYSTSQVADTTEQLKKGIEGLPTTLPNIMSMQQQFTALSGDIDEATDLTIALNNATLAGGQGQQVANSALEQWYQIIAKGKPDAQSWQIINSAMPAQMNQIAEAVMGAGKKAQDLFEEWQQGTVTTQQIKDALIELNTKGGSGLASFEKQAQDSTGGIGTSMANLKTAISNSIANVIEAIGQSNISSLFDSLKGVVKKVGDSLADMAKKVDWKKFGKLVSGALGLVIDAFSWIVKNNKLVITAVTGFVTAMAAKKITEFGNSIKNSITQLMTSISQMKLHTTAVVADTTATNVATTATKNLNTAMSSNVIATVVGLIGTLVTALDLFGDSADDSKNKTKELNESLDDYNESMKQIEESRKEYLSSNLTELDNYENLYKELQMITDENGKVQEGYEKRAEYITSTLSEALGIEIEIVDGQVQKYGELETAINSVIEKKKAQIILEAHTDEYNEAIKNQTEREEEYATALQNTKEKHNELNKILKKAAEFYGADYEELKKYYNGELDLNEASGKTKETIIKLRNEYSKYHDELSNANYNLVEAKTNLENEGKALADNREIIYKYNQATEEFAQEHYDVMGKIYTDTVKFNGETVEDNRKTLEENKKNADEYINYLLQNQDKYSEKFINSEKERIDREKENWQNEMEEANIAITNQNKVKVEKTLEGINDQLKVFSDHKYEFKEASDGNMQLYVDGIASGNAISQETMEKLVDGTVQKIKDKKMDAKEAGEFLVDGVNLGIGNKNKQSTVFKSINDFGKNILARFKASLDEHSPSKASRLFGQYLLKGFNLGIGDEEQNSLKVISDFSNQVLDTFGSTVDNVSTEFDKIRLNNTITPQFTQEITEKATTIRESRPVVLNIDTFNNNTDKDIETLSNELAFYVRQKEVTG